MKKLICAAAAALLLLLAVTALADTPKDRTFYVSLSAREDGGEMPMDAVMWQRVGNKYYLFLPGAKDLSEARVWFAGNGEITLNGTKLRSGDRAPGLKDGETAILRFMGKGYSVRVMQGSPIPALFINTATGDMKKIERSKEYREAADLLLFNSDGTAGYDGALEHIKLRGHTSALFNKKGFTIKLAQKTGLLGMGKAKKWVLTSNARDHSLIRNQICFGMAAYVGMAYTPACKPVELYLNHSYNGAYILQEKVEIGENRIDIRDLEKVTAAVNEKELSEYRAAGSAKSAKGKFKYIEIPENPEDITGGYLLEYECSAERYNSGPSVYTTDRGKLIVVQEPEYASKAQMEYISAFMQGFENAIFAADGVDPDTGKRYDEYIDFDSLVLKYMLEEISKNLDGNKSSQFFYKPDDSVSRVAFAGPAWDYDSTFGDYGRAKDSKGLVVPTGFYHNTVDRNGYWWPHLYEKPEYYEAICRMWRERYAPAMRVVLGMEQDGTGRVKSIEEYASAIEKTAAMNFILWPMRQSSENIARCGKTFKANIEYLTDYITKRYEFLESEWGKEK